MYNGNTMKKAVTMTMSHRLLPARMILYVALYVQDLVTI